MKKVMNWLKNEESGQGMVEYALIIALVGVLLVGALTFLKGEIATSLNDAGNKITP